MTSSLAMRWRGTIFLSVLLASGAVEATGLGSADKADRMRILKSERQLQLVRDGEVLKTYPIALGSHPVGAKRRRGDGRTPEGYYIIDGRNAKSLYHRSLHLSYPNDIDRARA